MFSFDKLFDLIPVEDLLRVYLLPFDIARLYVATRWDITPHLKKWFMNPIRDVFDKPEDIHLLVKAGARMILLGQHAGVLQSRLKDPEDFIKKYGNDFKINLIAIAYSRPGTNAPLILTQFPSIRFTVTDQIVQNLGKRADIAHSWFEQSLSTLPCTNTSLAPMATPPTSNIRLQQFRLNLRCCWFHTIDFVYPDEALGIFDLSSDTDMFSTSGLVIKHDGEACFFVEMRSNGSWLPPVVDSERLNERGTPALTRHRPRANMDEVLIRLEIPSDKKAGIIRMPTPR